MRAVNHVASTPRRRGRFELEHPAVSIRDTRGPQWFQTGTGGRRAARLLACGPMRIATFLPHVGVFGGVRRYLELGNAWTAAGHAVTLYHPAGGAPAWLPYAGRVAPLAAAAGEPSDLALCSDPHTWGAFRAHRSARHVYYCVLERDPGLAAAIADRGVTLAANSSPLRAALERRGGRAVLDGIGGIDPRHFSPGPERPAAPLRVLVNGRRSRPKKGTDLILRALAGLASRGIAFEIVLFDTPGPGERDPRDAAPLPANARYVIGPTQDELVALYRGAHVFIAAERKAGWCNTALEAMACGCAVACTRSGTTDFARDGETALVVPWRHEWFIRRAARRLLEDAPLRAQLATAGPPEAARWAWPRLAAKLLGQLEA
jgi:glycosyltransferase involved in cell wall biosynthesis